MPRRYLLILCLFLLSGCGEATPANGKKTSGSGPGGAEVFILAILAGGIGLFVWYLRRRPAHDADDIGAVLVNSPPEKPRRPGREASSAVRIELNREEKRVPVAVEVVKVPSGVTISVKRTRVVEHAVEVQSGDRVQAQVQAKLLGFLQTSVRGEIERRLGRTYKESSSTEYEVKLNGEANTQYKLVWVDVWIEGEATTPQDGVVAFQFRDRAELEVLPVG